MSDNVVELPAATERKTAQRLRRQYEAYLEAGFTRPQAFQLILAQREWDEAVTSVVEGLT